MGHLRFVRTLQGQPLLHLGIDYPLHLEQLRKNFTGEFRMKSD